jgi:hypothetical protein
MHPSRGHVMVAHLTFSLKVKLRPDSFLKAGIEGSRRVPNSDFMRDFSTFPSRNFGVSSEAAVSFAVRHCHEENHSNAKNTGAHSVPAEAA